jgi:hypothetical protein
MFTRHARGGHIEGRRRRAAGSLPLLLLGALLSTAAAPPSLLQRARESYNQHRYDDAIQAAGEARRTPAAAQAAALLFARAHLERFRLSEDASSLAAAREALRQVDPGRLTPRERAELLFGLGEALYLEERFGSAAELLDVAVAQLKPGDPERALVLEWLAIALDRQAQLDPAAEQRSIYARLLERMEQERRQDAGSPIAAYWLAAAARGSGELQRAWNAAIAGWIGAPLAGTGQGQLRADLDRLVQQAIIPERAREFVPAAGAERQREILRATWERIKQQWGPVDPASR